jgi:hypothetical protein
MKVKESKVICNELCSAGLDNSVGAVLEEQDEARKVERGILDFKSLSGFGSDSLRSHLGASQFLRLNEIGEPLLHVMFSCELHSLGFAKLEDVLVDLP